MQKHINPSPIYYRGRPGPGPGPVGYRPNGPAVKWFQFQWEEKNGQLVRRTNFVRARSGLKTDQFKIVFAEIHKKITGSGGYPTITTTSQYCISTST
jgi:hypothetical protein